MSDRTCSVDGCERPFHSHDYCAMHWQRVKAHGDPGPVGKVKQLGRPRSKSTTFAHGTAQGYGHHRCRCSKCRAWRNAYQKAYAVRRFAAGTFKHGVEGYACGCRCETCSTARRERSADWYRRNTARAKDNASRNGEVRRARQRNLPAFKVTDREWRRLCNRFDNRCAYCSERKSLQREHVVPISRGGQHSIGNLLPACKSCNLSKGTKFLSEWRASCLTNRLS